MAEILEEILKGSEEYLGVIKKKRDFNLSGESVVLPPSSTGAGTTEKKRISHLMNRITVSYHTSTCTYKLA